MTTRMTRRRAVLIALALPFLAVALAPEGWLGCVDPDRLASPDGAWTVSMCPRPSFAMAMPGHGGNPPAWLVLRDRMGAIRGVSGLDAVNDMFPAGGPAKWTADRFSIMLSAEMPLRPARNGFERWFDDRIWRLRALAGWTTTSDDFH